VRETAAVDVEEEVAAEEGAWAKEEEVGVVLVRAAAEAKGA
jgi:hypothetical protein